jgi:iron complex transport system substrate-binding protein
VVSGWRRARREGAARLAALSAFAILGALSATAAVAAAASAAAGDAPDRLRVVALGSATTEIVFDLGMGDRLAGVDSSSLFPEAATRLPQIGYQRQISAEGVLSLAPTLVLATDESGPPAALEQIAGAGVRILVTPSPRDAEGAARRIVEIGEALGRASEARALAGELLREMRRLGGEIAAYPTHPRVLFIYARAGGAPTVAGKGTAADAMLRLAGAENATGEIDGYKPLTPEAAVAASPEVVVVVSRGLESLGGEEALWRLPGLNLTPAGRSRRLLVVDDLEFLGFGPRLAGAVAALSRGLREKVASGATP